MLWGLITSATFLTVASLGFAVLCLVDYFVEGIR